MRTVIVGAGEVGTSIARSLAPDHDVVVIDIDADRAEQLKYDLDVMTLPGDGNFAVDVAGGRHRVRRHVHRQHR